MTPKRLPRYVTCSRACSPFADLVCVDQATWYQALWLILVLALAGALKAWAALVIFDSQDEREKEEDGK